MCLHKVVVVVVCFHDLKFCLSSQLKAASCARCRSEMPPSKHVNIHSQYASWFVVHRSRRVARGCNPTDACCCGIVPRLIGTCLAGSIGHGAGPSPVAGWTLINYLFGTSTIWFCHRVRQRCWMVGASSGRLHHIGRLDFSRGRG